MRGSTETPLGKRLSQLGGSPGGLAPPSRGFGPCPTAPSPVGRREERRALAAARLPARAVGVAPRRALLVVAAERHAEVRPAREQTLLLLRKTRRVPRVELREERARSGAARARRMRRRHAARADPVQHLVVGGAGPVLAARPRVRERDVRARPRPL